MQILKTAKERITNIGWIFRLVHVVIHAVRHVGQEFPQRRVVACTARSQESNCGINSLRAKIVKREPHVSILLNCRVKASSRPFDRKIEAVQKLSEFKLDLLTKH